MKLSDVLLNTQESVATRLAYVPLKGRQTYMKLSDVLLNTQESVATRLAYVP